MLKKIEKGVAQSRPCATPLFFCFFNDFIGFVEYNIGCGKKSTLRHTLSLAIIRGARVFRVCKRYFTKYEKNTLFPYVGYWGGRDGKIEKKKRAEWRYGREKERGDEYFELEGYGIHDFMIERFEERKKRR
jgi:hypothetical protein